MYKHFNEKFLVNVKKKVTYFHVHRINNLIPKKKTKTNLKKKRHKWSLPNGE